MLNSDPKSKVTLESLLKLKRAERPSPEFWENFESELRQKQLTALVKKRRWWHEMPVWSDRRVYLPAGAAAAVAFALISMRSVAPLPVAETEEFSSPQLAATEPQSEMEMLPATVVAAASRFMAADYPAESTLSSPQIMAVPRTLPPARPHDEATPSARSIAANLARLEQSEPELVNSVMGNRLSSPVRVQTVAAQQADDEASVGLDHSRKYRLIARYADRALSPEPVAPASVRERIARRLGDDLVDDISRIGVKGSRVSLKF